MRLKLLLIISSIFLVSCGGMPAKPQVELCVLNVPGEYANCNLTKGELIKTSSDFKAMVEQAKASGTRIPLKDMDKSVCFRPTEWEKVQNYIDALERHINGSDSESTEVQ